MTDHLAGFSPSIHKSCHVSLSQTTQLPRKICGALLLLPLRAHKSPVKPVYQNPIAEIPCGPFSPTRHEVGSSASLICSAGSLPYRVTSTLMPNSFIASPDGAICAFSLGRQKAKPHGPACAPPGVRRASTFTSCPFRSFNADQLNKSVPPLRFIQICAPIF